MNDDQFGDPISGEWAMPPERPFIAAYPEDDKSLLGLWARFIEWLIGRREEE
jgi:hypothetical protein